MANLPKISNCPIRDEESNICMCLNKKCRDEVGDNVCFAIRNAFEYGCGLTEVKYINELKGMCEIIVKHVNELQKEVDDG